MRIAQQSEEPFTQWTVIPFLQMPLQFEWDARKAKVNEAKHGISLAEAITVFSDPLAQIFDDPGHSESERREIIIGIPIAGFCFW